MRLRAALLSVLLLAPGIEAAAQQPFGGLIGSFPTADAAGKRIKLTGYVKTDRVADGNASLWWRADEGPSAIVFNNWMKGNATRTFDWRRFEVQLSMPSNITKVVFGVLHTGTGTAWFADLKIEIDKKPYTGDLFDLGLTSSNPRGFSVLNDANEYEFDLDSTKQYNGKPSFRIRKVQ